MFFVDNLIGPGELAHFKFVGTEVDQEAVLEAGRFQVAEDLRLVLRGQRFGWLQFDEINLIFHQKIRQVISNRSSILVINANRVLLLHVQLSLPQSMRQRVFINFLQMSVPVINMDVIGCLPDLVSQCIRCLS